MRCRLQTLLLSDIHVTVLWLGFALVRNSGSFRGRGSFSTVESELHCNKGIVVRWGVRFFCVWSWAAVMK
jgi:hypothetical protein